MKQVSVFTYESVSIGRQERKRGGKQAARRLVTRAVAFLLAVLLFAAVLPGEKAMAASELDIAECDVRTKDPSFSWYLRGVNGDIKSAEAYVGMEKVTVSECEKISESKDAVSRTLILLDNSSSIGNASADRIHEILTNIVWNHDINEQFAVKTFSTEVDTLQDFTDNYALVKNAIDAITYEKQPTYVRNVLYQEIKELSEDGGLYYNRIVFITDGTDESKRGVTNEELLSLLDRDETKIPVIVIGCTYKASVENLEKMYQLSRKTNSPYYSLDDSEDVNEIANGIDEDLANVYRVQITIPPEMKDGSEEAIRLILTTGKGEQNISHTVTMPSASKQEMDAMEEARKAAEEEAAAKAAEEAAAAAANAAPAEKTPWYRTELMQRVIPAVILGAGLLIAFLILRRKKRETVFVEMDEKGSETAWSGSAADPGEEMAGGPLTAEQMAAISLGTTPPGKKPEIKQEAMQEAKPMPAADAGSLKTGTLKAGGARLILTNIKDETETYTIRKGESRVIGRSASRSEIVFDKDRMLSARHLIVEMGENGTARAENLDVISGSYRNGELFADSTELYDGDIVRVGNTQLRVNIAEEE